MILIKCCENYFNETPMGYKMPLNSTTFSQENIQRHIESISFGLFFNLKVT